MPELNAYLNLTGLLKKRSGRTDPVPAANLWVKCTG